MLVEGLLAVVIVGITLSGWLNLLLLARQEMLESALETASQNFQASNTSVAEAIVSLGSLLDDLDEVSGELVRPPAIGDVVAQLVQMWGMGVLQQKMKSVNLIDPNVSAGAYGAPQDDQTTPTEPV